MLSVKNMKALERQASKHGIFPKDLMGNAGEQIFKTIEPKLLDHHIIIFAGPGNNGGDGFATAKHFTKNPVIIFFFGQETQLTEESKLYYDEIKDHINIIPITTPKDLNDLHFQPNHELIFIDALLGTGFQGEPREPIKSGIEFFNQNDALKFSIDVPSGTNADTGEHTTTCQPDHLIALHDIKQGTTHLENITTIVDIGIPN